MIHMTMETIAYCFQVAEEECGTDLAAEIAAEPYFVDFMRDAPEPTGSRMMLC